MTLSIIIINIKIYVFIENNSNDNNGDDNNNNNKDSNNNYFIYNNKTIIKQTAIKSYNNIPRCLLFN
jgi:hypothetical protein